VALAVEARRRLEEEGIPTAVVSMPSWELFERQDGSGVRPKWRARSASAPEAPKPLMPTKPPSSPR
jgi:transketolase